MKIQTAISVSFVFLSLNVFAQHRNRVIDIGPHEAVDCAKYENYTQIRCNPYRESSRRDDAFSPAFDLVLTIQPWEIRKCLHDRAGGIIYVCEVPETWVDTNQQE